MTTYNGAAFLTAQLDSILAQDTDSWHLTVSDDGSTDATPEILEDYTRRFPEKITRVFSGRRFGNARDHFFWLMAQCKAEYMHFAARFGKLVYLGTPTLDYRQHRGNSVGAKDVRSLGYIVGKFRRISELRCFFGRKKDQAKVFAESYRGCLTDGDRALVNAFSCKRSSLTFKIGFLRFISGFFRRAGFLLLW